MCVDVGNSVRDRCSGKAERAGRVRARIVSPCPGPQRSLALAAAAARRNSSESTPEKSALPRIAGDGMQTARARFSSRLSGRTCGSGAAAAPRKALGCLHRCAARTSQQGCKATVSPDCDLPYESGANNGPRRAFWSEVNGAPKLTGLRYGNAAAPALHGLMCPP